MSSMGKIITYQRPYVINTFKDQQGNIDYKCQGYKNLEFDLLGLVVESVHPDQRSE